MFRRYTLGLLVAFTYSTVLARGASPYLPLNLAPEIERQIERVLILADKPAMKRPFAAATVLDALPAACARDPVLCRSVRRYLDRYMQRLGVDDATAELSARQDREATIPNRRGLGSNDEWFASAQAHWQPSDYVLLNLGGVAYPGEGDLTGTMLSFGWERAQVDVGFRDHWLSPLQSSAMLLSTQAPTLPSVTLSNYSPLTRLGLNYEIFLAQMEYSSSIAYQSRFTAGRARLAGLHVAIEPAPGWSLAANRIMQFGGGERGGRSLSDFARALFRPHDYDNRSDSLGQEAEFGNQAAAWTSRFIFPGHVPFAVYFEYAGEDNSYEGNFRLGNAALSMGVDIPKLWQQFDLTYEISEWQNGWYVHGIYLNGLSNEGHVLGHWGGDWRVLNDGVGAQSHTLRVGWRPGFGGVWQLQARTLQNESYGAFRYERAYDVSVSYARSLAGFTVGAEALLGRDVFGEDFGRISGFVRLAGEWAESNDSAFIENSATDAHVFIDAGVNVSRLQIRLGDRSPKQTTPTDSAPHMAVGARRMISEHSDLGARVEFDRINGDLLLAVRALDYRYRFNNPLALSLFAGAARYDLATPAYGYYFGTGAQWRLPRVDLNVDLRYGDKIARDKLLPTDPSSDPRPDMFYDLVGATAYVSYRF